MTLRAKEPSRVVSPQVTIGLVGGGKGGSAILDLILAWPKAKVAVVIDADSGAPALGKAKALGIATASHHLEVFAYPVELVLEVTGYPAVLKDLLDAKPPGIEVIGAGSLRFFWDLLEELKLTQEQISQTERLSAIGQLASGIAHDVNNLLATILGSTQLLLERRGRDPDLVRFLKLIKQAASDGARAIERIREFSRPGSSRHHVPVDLVQLLGEVREFTRPRWENEAQAAGIAYDIRIEAEPVPMISGDPAELREALINLLLNALEAMPRGGQVRLTAATEAKRVRVMIQDTGGGMSEEVRRRAFEPFFTTKGRRGSGLGLRVVWEIIQRHGGEITFATEEGKGTSFTLHFPIRSEAFEPEAPAPRPKFRRPAKILLIDDERAFRTALRQLLERQGHAVVEVGLITGCSNDLDPAKVAANRIEFVLAKPFQLDELLLCVAKSLGESRAPSELVGWCRA